MPFRSIQVHSGGNTFLCCPSWAPVSIGDLSKQPLDEIWNGEKARALRESILDDSFRYCNADLCPFLRTVQGPVRLASDVTDEDLKAVIAHGTTIMPHGPKEIFCCFDKSCNLSCPTCRTAIIVETGRRDEILSIQKKIEEEALKDADLLYITGSGDPFGSPFSRDWLRSMKAGSLGVRRIYLHTNGLLWTPESWDAIPPDVRKRIAIAQISIDATSPGTYAVNRRGGSFDRLLHNLEFICSLRRQGPLERLSISMVVQQNNFREMPDFVRLGLRLGVDEVYFMKLNEDFNSLTHSEFSEAAVHLPEHPDFSEFGRVLKDPVFRDPIAFLGNLSHLA